MDKTTALVAALGSATAAVLGAWSLVVKERAKGAVPLQLLRRLWDYLVSKNLHHDVPPLLAESIVNEIEEGDDPE